MTRRKDDDRGDDEIRLILDDLAPADQVPGEAGHASAEPLELSDDDGFDPATAEIVEDTEPRELAAELSGGTDAPDFQDACLALDYPFTANDYRFFDQARRELGYAYPDNRSQLLGWPDIIQNNMTLECELVSRGHYLGGSWESVPQEERDALRAPSVQDWRLLFQLDTVASGDFELMFGDCGRIYFYIRREDLLARRFDRAWLVLQCM